MNTRRLAIHLISVALLLLWGGIMLYFYLSQRLVPWYLQPLGNFRNMVLYSGIGLIVLGVFNLATMGAEDADCCGGGHEHQHDKDCCGGHEHGHEEHHHHHDHAQDHAHNDCCDHDHHHEHEAHSHHSHHEHDHEHGSAHSHGILEDSGPLGRTFALLVLALPMLVAATFTPDKPSAAWVQNKGLYNQKYDDTSRKEQFALRKDTAQKPEITVNAVPAISDAQRTPGSAAGNSGATPTETTTAAASSSAAKSFGSFTLADLKAQVPQNKEGEFILEVPELYYTAGDKEVQGVLKGQPVITTAQVLPEKVNNADGKRLRIFRLLVQCCAADARPYSIPVEFEDKAPELKEMSWIELHGKMDYVTENGQVVPLMKATSHKEAAAPTDAMLY